MDLFASIIAKELQEFSVELLEPGIAPKMNCNKSRTGSSTIRSIIGHSKQLIEMIPVLLRELAQESDSDEAEFVSSRSPKRSVASRSPQDYALAGESLVPTRWNQSLTSSQRPEMALRWLLHILEKQLANHLDAKTRLQKYVEEAAESLRGASDFAVNNMHDLSQALNECESTLARLRKTVATVSNASTSFIKPSKLLPVPYPQEPSWQKFRRIARNISNPEMFIASFISEVCSAPVLSADLPYLYQRWVALKIIMSLKYVGWQVIGDPIGAIWLGGRLQFKKGNNSISTWIEPRLTSAKSGEHPSGYVTKNQQERTPDFLIIAHRDSGDEAFVLDATLSRDQKILSSKGKYLQDIESSKFRVVAGVKLNRYPLRSWAASPIWDSNCRVSDQLGHLGVIPMNPLSWNTGPLDSWIGDLVALI